MQNGLLAWTLSQITSTVRHVVYWVLLKILFEKRIPLEKKIGHIDIFQPSLFKVKINGRPPTGKVHL